MLPYSARCQVWCAPGTRTSHLTPCGVLKHPEEQQCTQYIIERNVFLLPKSHSRARRRTRTNEATGKATAVVFEEALWSKTGFKKSARAPISVYRFRLFRYGLLFFVVGITFMSRRPAQSVCQRCLAAANAVINSAVNGERECSWAILFVFTQRDNWDVMKCSVRGANMNAVGQSLHKSCYYSCV